MAKGVGRNGELFRELCDPAHLIRSALAAAKGKRRKPEVSKFLLDKQELWDAGSRIERVLGDLRLRLHERKGGVHSTRSQIPFLGFTLRRGTSTPPSKSRVPSSE